MRREDSLLAGRTLQLKGRSLPGIGWLTLDNAIALATGLAGLLLYLATLAPSILEGDSGEFQFTAPTLGVMHTTGYPLYTLLGWLWTHLLFFATPAYAMNLFSAIIEAATLSLTYLIILRLAAYRPVSRQSDGSIGGSIVMRLAAVLGAALLATSYMFWSQAIVATVYSLHVFFVALTLWLLIKIRDSRAAAGSTASKYLLWFAFSYGLGLAHHRTLLLLAPGYLLFLLFSWPGLWRHWRLLGGALLVAAAPLLLYLYLPWRAAVDPRYPYLSHELVAWILGSSFAGQVAPSTWLSDLPVRLARLWSVVGGQFGIWGFALTVVGLLWLALRQWRVAFLLLAVALPTAAFAYLYRYGDPSAPIFNIGLYLLPVFLVLAIAIGYLVAQIARLLQLRRRALAQVAMLLLVVLLPALQLGQNYARVDMHANASIDRYARATIDLPFGQNALIFGKWDTLTPLWYLQYVENRRPDITVFDSPLLTGAWTTKIFDSVAAGSPVYIFGNLSRMPASVEALPFAPALGYTPRSDRDYSYAESEPLIELRSASDTIVKLAGNPAPLGNRLTLAGYSLVEQPQAGQAAEINLFWRAEQQLQQNYRIVLRLKDERGRVIAQSDKAADDFWSSTYPTSHWQPGTLMRDIHHLQIPAGTPPLTYTLEAGAYDPDTGAWLEANGQQTIPTGNLKIKAGEPNAEPAAQQRLNPPDATTPVYITGYDFTPADTRPGAGIDFTLYWRARANPEGAYHIIADLRDNAGNIYSSRQIEPLGRQYSPQNWRAGELVRDPETFIVGPDAPNGQLEFYVTIAGPAGPGPAIRIGSVTVHGRERIMQAPQVQQIQAAAWQNGITLYGYSLSSSTLKPGAQLQLALAWQATGRVDKNYKVFTHLVDAQGKLWAQADAQPCAGQCPTSGWLPGEYLSDNYTLNLKPDAPPGEYTLYVGFYDEISGQRLPLQTGGDHLILNIKITVK